MTRITPEAADAFAAALTKPELLSPREISERMDAVIDAARKPKYDLKRLGYFQSDNGWGARFTWAESPEGLDFWLKQNQYGLTAEGRAALAEMAEQYRIDRGARAALAREPSS